MSVLFRFAALLFAVIPAYAAPMGDNTPALAPPSEIHAAQQDSPHVPQAEKQLNLHDELRGPKPGEGVEVRAYTRKDGVRVQEYSIKGRVYMVRVEPGGGLPAYYLYDTNGDGVFDQRLPGHYKRISPPMWVIRRF